MSLVSNSYSSWRKTAEIPDFLKRQMAASTSMRSDFSAVIAKPDLIEARVHESFKLGALAGLLAAAIGGIAGSTVGIPELGASLGGYLGTLGGAVKGQANANKEHLESSGFNPKGINLLRYAVPDTGAAFLATSILPESGHIHV